MKTLEELLKKNLDNTLYKNITWKYTENGEIIFYFPHEYYREYFKINFFKKIQNLLIKHYDINKIILTNSEIKKEENLEYFKFKPRYTFKNFFYGQNNKILIKTLLNVIKKNILIYNPIIIWGKQGCGKTHLLYAIGNFYLQNKLNTKIIYLDLKIQNIKKLWQEQFINKFDILLIDNIQEIQGNLKIQDKMTYLITKCIDTNKILFFTSNCKILDLYNIDKKLNSILQSGLILNLKYPDINTKSIFINFVCKKFNLNIPEDKKFEISFKYKNIYEIKSLLYSIISESQLTNRNIDIDKKINIKQYNINKITTESIINIVSKHYNISPTLIKSKNKKKNVVQARNIAIYLCRELLGLSTIKLGKIFNRDHSTILHSIKKVNNFKKLNNDFDNMLKKVLTECKSTD